MLAGRFFAAIVTFDVFRLKNWMLIGNYLANVVAFVLMEKLIFRGGPLPSNETRLIVASSGDIFRGCATIAIALFIFYNERLERAGSDAPFDVEQKFGPYNL